MQKNTREGNVLEGNVNRRNFLKFSGAAASAAVVLVACSRDDEPSNTSNGVDLGSGDTGILNYAYTVEQLEAAFYTQVIASPFSGMTTLETAFLTDIRDHEIAHREFFKAALGSSAIAALKPDFSSIKFSDRTSVLNAAKTFEDLGVAAYNCAGKLTTNPAYLGLAGKIVPLKRAMRPEFAT